MVVARGRAAGRAMESCLMGTEFQFWRMKSFGDRWRWLYNNVNVLHATEKYT